MQKWIYNDGGRSMYYKARNVDDCGTRAVAIATGADYKETYMKIKSIIGYTPRNGIFYTDFDKVMQEYRFVLHGCGDGESTTRLCAEELSEGVVVCRIRHHYVTMIDGVVYDTWDSTVTKKGESPIVERYWTL